MSGLTEDEMKALRLTAELFNALQCLPVLHSSDMKEAVRDLHNIQNRIMARCAMRAHVGFFTENR